MEEGLGIFSDSVDTEGRAAMNERQTVINRHLAKQAAAKQCSPTVVEVPYKFIHTRLLDDKITKDVEVLMEFHHCLSCFCPSQYVEITENTSMEVRNKQLEIWSKKHNQLRSKMIDSSTRSIWTTMMTIMEQSGCKQASGQAITGKTDLLMYFRDPNNYKGVNYPTTCEILYKMKYVMAQNSEVGWFSELLKLLETEEGVCFDRSSREANRSTNCYWKIAKKQHQNIMKNIEKREIIGHHGQLVRKGCKEKYWDKVRDGVFGCRGMIIRLKSSLTFEQICDACSNMMLSEDEKKQLWDWNNHGVAPTRDVAGMEVAKKEDIGTMTTMDKNDREFSSVEERLCMDWKELVKKRGREEALNWISGIVR